MYHTIPYNTIQYQTNSNIYYLQKDKKWSYWIVNNILLYETSSYKYQQESHAWNPEAILSHDHLNSSNILQI
jgi:hypothetical protein